MSQLSKRLNGIQGQQFDPAHLHHSNHKAKSMVADYLKSLDGGTQVVMATRGAGKSLGPQLMAEIGDVTSFAHRGSIIIFRQR